MLIVIGDNDIILAILPQGTTGQWDATIYRSITNDLRRKLQNEYCPPSTSRDPKTSQRISQIVEWVCESTKQNKGGGLEGVNDRIADPMLQIYIFQYSLFKTRTWAVVNSNLALKIHFNPRIIRELQFVLVFKVSHIVLFAKSSTNKKVEKKG